MWKRSILILMAFIVYSPASIMAQDNIWIDEPDDLASRLSREIEQFFGNMAKSGSTPRIFTGVTASGLQTVVMLSGLPLPENQRRDFLIWLCRAEAFTAYAYGTVVASKPDQTGAVPLGVMIFASSQLFDGEVYLPLERLADGTIRLEEAKRWWVEADKSAWQPYSRLQRTQEPISDDGTFATLWSKLEPTAMKRQRPAGF